MDKHLKQQSSGTSSGQTGTNHTLVDREGAGTTSRRGGGVVGGVGGVGSLDSSNDGSSENDLGELHFIGVSRRVLKDEEKKEAKVALLETVNLYGSGPNHLHRA